MAKAIAALQSVASPDPIELKAGSNPVDDATDASGSVVSGNAVGYSWIKNY
jgi:hypothetical protein